MRSGADRAGTLGDAAALHDDGVSDLPTDRAFANGHFELEGRSAGLQRFLSFYLIFLVESEGAHGGAILLLDEPGLN